MSLHDSVLATYRDYPSQQTHWLTEIRAELWRAPEKPRGPVVERANKLLRGDFEEAQREEAQRRRHAEKRRLREWRVKQADQLIAERGRGTGDKPRAAWLEAADTEAATAVARTMRRRTPQVETDEQRKLASQLTRGRVTPGGRARGVR